jgi:hypothetical protein
MSGYNTQFIKDRVESPRVRGFVTRMHARLLDARGRQVTIHDGMLHVYSARPMLHEAGPVDTA